MQDRTNNIQTIRDETNDYYSDDDLFTIKSWGADLSFRELIERYKEGSLVKPELQRRYVWDKAEASRFIDSLLLGLPVPSIFLAQTDEERLLIVDGYQRIMTVFDFVEGIWSADGKVFKLSRSDKINRRWAGRAFSELEEADQRKIKNTTIHAIIFVQNHPSRGNTSLFQVFERINTSGRSLLTQEIRNCIYQGHLNTILFELNGHDSWRSLFGLVSPDPRMRDMEFILRFFALSSDQFLSVIKERISLKKFLSVYMGEEKNPDEAARERMKSRFTKVCDYILNTFGSTAFHNVSPTSPDRLVSKFSPTVFDSISIACDEALYHGSPLLEGIPEMNRRILLRNPEYRSAISQETMKTDNIRLRIRMANEFLFQQAPR